MIVDFKIIPKRLILFSMIILTSLFLSCTGMRPPGFHNSDLISEKQTNSDNETDEQNIEISDNETSEFDVSKIKEFEEKIKQQSNEVIPKDTVENISIIQSDEVVAGEPIVFEDNSDENQKIETDYSEKLSTLDNQMNDITHRLDDSDNQISAIKKTLNKLENRISDIERQNKKQSKVKPIRSEQKKKNNDFIIKPDEKIKKTKKVNISYNSEPVIDNANDKNKFEAGIKFFNAGKYNLTIQTLKNIENIKAKDLFNPVNYYIAKSYYNTGDFDSALHHLNKILLNNETNYKPESHFLIAECYIKSGKADKAKAVYKEFVSNYPANKYTPQARKMLQKL